MKHVFYLDDDLALESNLFLTAILYERTKASSIKYHILHERVKYLKAKK